MRGGSTDQISLREYRNPKKNTEGWNVFAGIQSGADLTITHPDASRFFMTIREAVSLVLQAVFIGEHGDILVLDMGNPIKILDLAKLLIRLSGKSPGEVKLRFSGIRPGEKLCEELFYENESITPTSCRKISTARSPIYSWSLLQNQLEELRQAFADDEDGRLRFLLNSIVTAPLPEAVLLSESAGNATTQHALLSRAATA